MLGIIKKAFGFLLTNNLRKPTTATTSPKPHACRHTGIAVLNTRYFESTYSTHPRIDVTPDGEMCGGVLDFR